MNDDPRKNPPVDLGPDDPRGHVSPDHDQRPRDPGVPEGGVGGDCGSGGADGGGGVQGAGGPKPGTRPLRFTLPGADDPALPVTVIISLPGLSFAYAVSNALGLSLVRALSESHAGSKPLTITRDR